MLLNDTTLKNIQIDAIVYKEYNLQINYGEP